MHDDQSAGGHALEGESKATSRDYVAGEIEIMASRRKAGWTRMILERAAAMLRASISPAEHTALLAERDAAVDAVDAARTGWQPVETAPKNATNVLLRYAAQGWNKPQVIVAHWAHGGGCEQPPFGPGWFRAVLGSKGEILMFAEAPPNPDAWMPLPCARGEGAPGDV